jgi:phenylacetate-CoA ligase
MMPTLSPLPTDIWRELTAPARLPGLTAVGQEMLVRLRSHPAAPYYRDFSGHRLTHIEQWQARWRNYWLQRLATQRIMGTALPPAWVWFWIWRQHRRVAVWPSLRTLARGWSAIPTMCRADLQRALHERVPRDLQTRRLICFTTSGTTGHPIRVPSLPGVAAAYLALHERALTHHGLRLRAGSGDVGIVLAGYQQRCFTYVSVNPLRGECGLAKINLHPGEWRHPDERSRYLDALAPELISGDPVSLGELAALPMRHRPRALLSTSMAMTDGLRRRLGERFDCPVLDLYSMNEAGPIGVFDEALNGFLLLQPRMFVEILDATGHVLPEGEHGEVTLTGGINPCLPLLRYRTGDYARLAMTAKGPVLRDLQGRAPVRFRTFGGDWLNNVEITQSLRRFDLRRFALHQHDDGRLSLRIDADAQDTTVLHCRLRQAIDDLLGPQPLVVVALAADDKLRQYTSDLAGAACTS